MNWVVGIITVGLFAIGLCAGLNLRAKKIAKNLDDQRYLEVLIVKYLKACEKKRKAAEEREKEAKKHD